MSNERSFPPTIYWTNKKIETRADYLAGIRHEAWAFPYCRGFVPPVEWAREAWELDEVQRFLVPDIQWFLGRPGTLEAARKRLEATSWFLSTEQVVRLFLETRKLFSHQEWRFRKRFEAAFAEHVEFLPSELTRDEIIEALKNDGCDESRAILMADRAEQKKRASADPPRENDSYFWPLEGLRREWPGRNPPFEPGSLAAQIAAVLSEPGYRPSWEGWRKKIQDIRLVGDFYELDRSVSKTGSLCLPQECLLQASEVLATEHVIQLFLLLRSIGRGETEFRAEFEEGFPEHAPFLPPPGPEEPRKDWQGKNIGRDFGFYFSGRPVRVLIDTARITDWKSFHDVFADAFGFPEYYGCNLDAFFDCLSCLGSEESEMTKIQLPPKGVVVIELSDPADWKARCPGIYSGLVKTIGEINERRERRIVGVSIYPAGWTATIEGAEGADWPPDVDAHGNEISPFATRVDEPRPLCEYAVEACPQDQAFLKQKELTKKEYFALICADPWRFPDVEGFPSVPVKWASEAWNLPEFQDNFVSCLRNEVSKTGDVGLNRFSEILTYKQVIGLYLFFMETCCQREEEFRPCFEKAFPQYLLLLPPPRTPEEKVRSFRGEGVSRRRAILLAELDGASTSHSSCPFVKFWIEAWKIRDWESFHDLFASVFGFHKSYARSMDAWVQCLTSLDDPEDDLTSVKIPSGSVVVLELNDWQGLAHRCPDIYAELLEGAALVNQERLSIGLGPLLCLTVSGGRRY